MRRLLSLRLGEPSGALRPGRSRRRRRSLRTWPILLIGFAWDGATGWPARTCRRNEIKTWNTVIEPKDLKGQ
jgi:hypothetical protein